MTKPSLGKTFFENRSAIAGVLLLAMILLSLAHGIFSVWADVLKYPVGFSAIAAAALLIPNVGKGPRYQVGLLVILGVVLILYAISRGVSVNAIDVVTRNISMVMMILSVGFLKLIVIPAGAETEKLPVGRRAYFNTLLGVTLFGSVINISAPILIGDRLSALKRLDLFTVCSLSRVFTPCAAWSPFFGGMAVVLTYVPDLQLLVVMIVGLPLLLSALVLVYWISVWRHPEQVERFEGYPLKVSSLAVPAMLAVLVIIASQLLPELSILVVIAASALVLTLVVLVVRQGVKRATGTLVHFVLKVLPNSVNELLLFLAAGVLAAGLTGLVDAGAISSPIESFTWVTASLLLGVMILIAAMGVHPVIQISGLSPLVLAASPDPSLLASTFLFSWSLGTCASPLSGTHLMFQGRFHVPAWRIALSNWPFVLVLFGIASVLLFLSETLRS